MKKRLLALALCLSCSALLFAGCGKKVEESTEPTESVEESVESQVEEPIPEESEESALEQESVSEESAPSADDASAADGQLPDYLQEDGDASHNQVDPTLAEGLNVSAGDVVKIPTDSFEIKPGTSYTMESAEGKYEIKINSIEETADRNEFADQEADKVVMVSYSVTDVSFPDGVLVDPFSFKLVNASSKAYEYYPLNSDSSSASDVKIAEKGKTVDCTVAYDVNDGSKNVTLVFEDVFAQSGKTGILKATLS